MDKFYMCSGITIVSAFVSLGFSLAAISRSTGQALTVALYAGSRSLAMAVLSVGPLFSGSAAWMQAGAVGMIIVQSCDAIIGVVIGDRLRTFGPAGTAIANLGALLWFLG